VRRVAALAGVLLAAAAALALMGAGDGDSGRYRVDAIFDNASFLIGGQDVRIAGANVGSVADVTVTADNKARIAMEIDARYGPFRSDADCFIAPQSLIGERFVQCTPGSPRGRELVARDGHPPTVPVANTHSPVDADIVLETYRLPVRQRLTIVLNELGAGLAGNGERLNDAIRRANPALQATNEVLRVVDRDRAVLGRLIDRSDVVVGELAKRRGRVASFVDEAATVATTAAQRRGALAEGIERLPATLRETRSSLAALTGLADRSRPLLGDLRAAAAPTAHLVRSVPPLASAARPTLARLAGMARVGRSTLKEGAPVVRDLEAFAALAVPAGQLVADLTLNLEATGTTEGVPTFLRNVARTLARYDQYSHILPAYSVGPAECLPYASTPVPSCDARFEGELDKTSSAARALDYLLGG
jgi:virulence factor Mce-like protein